MKNTTLFRLSPVALGIWIGVGCVGTGYASVPVASLSFTPGDGLKPRIQSELGELIVGQRYSTGNAEVREIILADGTVITLSPDSEAAIDYFAYDRETGKGALTLRVDRGLVRVVGGAINNDEPIKVITGNAVFELNDGAASISLSPEGASHASLLYGESLSMTGAKGRETVVKPGFELTAEPSSSGTTREPSRTDGATVVASVAALETAQLAELGDQAEEGSETVRQQASETEQDGVRVATEDQAGGDVGVIADFSGGSAQGDGSGGFGAGVLLGAANLSVEQPSQANGDARALAQVRENATVKNGELIELARVKGRTTNRLFNSSTPLTQVMKGEEAPVVVGDSVATHGEGAPQDRYNLEYVFFNEDGTDVSFTLDAVSDVGVGPYTHTLIAGGYDTYAPFIWTSLQLPSQGTVAREVISSIYDSGDGQGSRFAGGTSFSMLQSGFHEVSSTRLGGGAVTLVQRDPNNFLLLEAGPAEVYWRRRDDLKAHFTLTGGVLSDPIKFLNEVIPNTIYVENSNNSISSTAQVDALASVIVSGIRDAGITNASLAFELDAQGGIPRIVDGGRTDAYQMYLDYRERVQPIVSAIEALASDSNQGNASHISVETAADAIKKLVGIDGVGYVRALPPTINIASMDGLSISSQGAVNDPVAFLNALGWILEDIALADVNRLADLVLDPNASAGAAISEGEFDKAGLAGTFSFYGISQIVNSGERVRETIGSTERFVFGTGDIGESRDSSTQDKLSVDKFVLSAGLDGFNGKSDAPTVANGIRAFARSETALGLTGLEDTGLLVINPGPSEAASTALHADFKLEGEGAKQQSTVSLTLGQMEYTERGSGGVYDAVLEGRTIGSSHGSIVRNTYGNDGGLVSTSTSEGTVAFNSPIVTTASGGGNDKVGDGWAGYLVLENYVPDNVDEADFPKNNRPQGGTEHAIGSNSPLDDQKYSYLRLGTAVDRDYGSKSNSRLTGRSNHNWSGWVGGLVEKEPKAGQVSLDYLASESQNLKVSTNQANSTVQATVELGGTVTSLGGSDADGKSAYISDREFAARTSGNIDAALVSGGLVDGGIDSSSVKGAMEKVPDYMKWGFFFGDLPGSTTALRNHVHLAPWVAWEGDVPKIQDIKQTGTVSYSGPAIGNVFNGKSTYTAGGRYTNEWKFGAGGGVVTLDFDGAKYTGKTIYKSNTPASPAAFVGGVTNQGGASRLGGIQGNFVSNGGVAHAGMAGRFSIRETNVGTDPVYRASGVFAADRQLTRK